jgi:pSer/pThr/pTyr-binding forkhead associated (FHA) protein
MTLFSNLAKFFGMDEAPSEDNTTNAIPRSNTQSSYTPPLTKNTTTNNLKDPYAPLWQSVDRHLSNFMSECVRTHMIYEPNDVFHIVRIQVAGTTTDTQAILQRFLDEFRPDSRRRATLSAINRICIQGVSTKDFLDFNRDFDQTELEESDLYATQLSETNQGGYEITIFGEWALQQAVPASATTSSTSNTSSVQSGAPIDLEINDAHGKRSLRITDMPFLLGRKSSTPQHAIAGSFISRKHGMLERDEQQRIWFVDSSVNGSCLDGVHVTPGERHPLRNGASLILGGEGANRSECPEIIVHWQTTEAEEGTPLRKPIVTKEDGASTPLRARLQPQDDVSNATPLSAQKNSATPKTLFMLGIQDAFGSHTIAVTKLPFAIGRDTSADCRLPEENEGVSRTHLIVQTIDAAGARIQNSAIGKWGTEVSGVEQMAEFTLPWGKLVKLAGKYTKTSPVTVQLLPPSH